MRLSFASVAVVAALALVSARSDAQFGRFALDNLKTSSGVDLDMTEVPFQPVDGLSVEGVRFEFRMNGLGSSDANYHSGGPGTTMFLDDPSIEGNAAGVLSIFFDVPTHQFEFGVAVNALSVIPDGVWVDYYTHAQIPSPNDFFLGRQKFDLTPLISFSEAHVNISDPLFQLTRADVYFPGSRSVPEPGSLASMGMGVAGLLVFFRRRKS